MKEPMRETKTKHTPGPWKAQGDKSGWMVRRNEAPFNVAEMWPSPQAEADARLIAAAPELLEACRGALAVVESINRNADREEIVALRAAIAKATGGES